MMKISSLVLLFVLSSYFGATAPSLTPAFAPPPDNLASRWNPKVVTAMSLGNIQTIVDWIWLRILVDPAMHPVAKGTHPQIFYETDLLTKLDPAFYYGYVGGGGLLAIVRKDFEGAKEILTRGHQYFLNEIAQDSTKAAKFGWESPFLISINLIYLYLFELEDIPAAAQIIRDVAKIQNVPQFLVQMGLRLEKEGGEYEVGLRLLNFLILQAKGNEVVEKNLLEKRKNLFLSQFLFDINKNFKQLVDSSPQTKIELLWRRFLSDPRTPNEDPFGGKLFLDATGRISSRTPHEAVFNLK